MNAPDSDETVREPLEKEKPGLLEQDDLSSDIEGRQISSKSGKRSSAKKLAASRRDFGSSPRANPVDGASGKTDELGTLDDVTENVEFAADDRPIVNTGKNEYPASQRSPKR
jgi:hypothetical protein